MQPISNLTDKILASRKVNIRQAQLTALGKSESDSSNRIGVIIQLNDVETFISRIQSDMKLKSMVIREEESEISDPDILYIRRDGFPVPYACARLTLDQIADLSAIDAVALIEEDLKIKAIDAGETSDEQD